MRCCTNTAAISSGAWGVDIISVVLDAPQDKIAALSGKIGRLPGVSAKTQYSNVISREGENQ